MFNLVIAMAEVSETGKRVFYTLFLIIIILLALISFIGGLILFVMKRQGEMFDREIYDAVTHKTVKNEKHFLKYAIKKNNVIFFERSLIPVLLIIVAVVVLLVYQLVTENPNYNPWSVENGFGSLLFIWDFSTIFTLNPGGSTGLLVNWPALTHSPTFDINYWCGYLCGTFFIVGGLWYLFNVQGLIARSVRILHLKKNVFEKSLKDFNFYNVKKKEEKKLD